MENQDKWVAYTPDMLTRIPKGKILVMRDNGITEKVHFNSFTSLSDVVAVKFLETPRSLLISKIWRKTGISKYTIQRVLDHIDYQPEANKTWYDDPERVGREINKPVQFVKVPFGQSGYRIYCNMGFSIAYSYAREIFECFNARVRYENPRLGYRPVVSVREYDPTQGWTPSDRVVRIEAHGVQIGCQFFHHSIIHKLAREMSWK